MSLDFLKPGSKIYFMGIGGTGMASAAGLCQSYGFKVVGSDQGIYPPMSTLLSELKIPVRTPYSGENIDAENADVYVVGNSISKGHIEIERVLKLNAPMTSFPELLGKLFLQQSKSIVVSGTHGKTTTTALIAHILNELNQEPSYLIGGVAKNFSQSFYLSKKTKPPFFVIEGDEYDTAFFDKNSKFLHYYPKYLILNNLEFDHADIFTDLAAIERQFEKLIHLVKDPKKIIANSNDPGIKKLLLQMGMVDQVTATAQVCSIKSESDGYWQIGIKLKPNSSPLFFRTILQGEHNASNIAQTVSLFFNLQKKGDLDFDEDALAAKLQSAIESFKGVARRMEKIGEYKGAEVFEDFAHHPTAIKKVISAFKATRPNRRVIVAFEPKSATARRSVLIDEFASSLGTADLVLVGECFKDQRIAPELQMNTKQLVEKIGKTALNFDSNEDLLNYITNHLNKDDSIIFMSSGSFSGIHHKLVK